MSEEEKEVKSETPEETVESKEQTSAPQAVKKPKKAETAASEKPAPAKAEKAKKLAAIEEIMATIKNMTVLELAELVKALEAEFGVSAAAPVVAAAPSAETAAPSAVEEKTEFNVILKEIGSNKISVIRAVRELTPLGLKESKDLVESAPTAVKEGISKDEATAANLGGDHASVAAKVTEYRKLYEENVDHLK